MVPEIWYGEIKGDFYRGEVFSFRKKQTGNGKWLTKLQGPEDSFSGETQEANLEHSPFNIHRSAWWGFLFQGPRILSYGRKKGTRSGHTKGGSSRIEICPMRFKILR